MNAKIEKLFMTVFSENNLKNFERFILFFATVGFIIHLGLILLNNNGILNFSIGEESLLQNPISAIYTPFSFILVYEAFLLIYYLPRSFTTSVGKQYEIISLILIRKIFKDIPEVNLDDNWLLNENNIQLVYDLAGILIVFFLIFILSVYIFLVSIFLFSIFSISIFFLFMNWRQRRGDGNHVGGSSSAAVLRSAYLKRLSVSDASEYKCT